MKYKLTAEESSTLLQQQTDFPFILMMKHGTMTMEYFSPKKIDTQSPHKQDELYVIIKGHATFLRDDERTDCKTNDVLFVPAGMIHRFENFSDDFATWVIFYGPEGGETII